MKTSTTFSPAELADRTLHLLIWSMFAVALIFSLSVAEFFASEPIAAIIDIAVKALGILILGLMALLVLLEIPTDEPRPAQAVSGRGRFSANRFPASHGQILDAEFPASGDIAGAGQPGPGTASGNAAGDRHSGHSGHHAAAVQCRLFVLHACGQQR